MNDEIILKKVFSRFFYSSMLAIICGCIGNIVGNIVIGNYVSEDRLGIMSLVMPIYYVFATVGNLLGIGGSALCAKYVGERKNEECKKAFTVTYILNFAVCIFFSVIFLLFLPQIVKILGTPEYLESDVLSYSLYMIIGGCFTSGVYLSFNFLRLDGRSVETTFTFVIMAIVNVLLDFILAPSLGVGGVSIASVSGALVSTLFGIVIIAKKSSLLGFVKVSPKEIGTYSAAVFKIGSPGATENVSILLKSYVFNRIIVAMVGTAALGSLSVVNSVNSFSMAFTSGCAGALIPLIGVFAAERDTVSIRRLIKSALSITLAIIAVFMALIIVFAPFVAGVFGVTENAAETVKAIRIFAISVPFALLSNSLIYVHLANKHTALANVLTALKFFAYAAISALFLMKIFGSTGLWVSFTVCEILTLLTALSIQFIISKRNKNYSPILLLNRKYEKEGKSFAAVTKDDDDSITETINKLSDFCENLELHPKKSMLITLALDEMSRMAAKYSTSESKSHIISIRVLVHQDILIMRLRYEGAMFNPIEYYESKKTDANDIDAMLELSDSLGIKMVVDTCEVVDYRTTFGLNNLTVITDKDYHIGGENISFRDAALSDIDDIYKIYHKVAITPENLSRRISKGTSSFSRRGGMFHPLDKDEILDIVSDQNEHVALGEQDGKVLGFVWFGEIDQSVFESLVPFEGCEKEAKIIIGDDAKALVGYAKDIVASDKKTTGILSKLLHAKAMEWMVKSGKEYCVFELYRVIGVVSENGEKMQCDVFNEASGNIMNLCGCKPVGETKVKEIKIGEKTVQIKPTIFLCNAKESLELALKLTGREIQ